MAIPEDKNLRDEVLTAFQAGLLGMVTPNLRGVSIRWTSNRITGLFLYDGNISDEETEIVSDVEGQVISHFKDHTIDLVAKITNAADHLDRFALDAWVYRRREHIISNDS